MNPQFYHRDSYEDPDTGEAVDEYEDPDTGEVVEFRNAGTTRDHRTNRTPSRGTVPPRTSSSRTRATVPRAPRGTPSRTRYVPRAPYNPQQPADVTTSGEYLAIKKDVIGDLIPMAGKIWAALLGQPDRPTYTGDPRSDYDNEALHREALAQHEQNQLRIMTVSDVLGRAVKLLMN